MKKLTTIFILVVVSWYITTIFVEDTKIGTVRVETPLRPVVTTGEMTIHYDPPLDPDYIFEE